MKQRERLFEIQGTSALFIIGAIVGIIGGLLIDFCLISFYRWLDFFQLEIKKNPNSLPITTDFWIFLVCTLLLIGITYYFYCILIKFVTPIKNHQGDKKDSIDLRNSKSKDEATSPDDKKKITELKSYEILVNCFKDNSALFSIIASVATIITLIQVFTVFSLGENWLGIILTGPFGFQSLSLVLFSLFGVILFVLYIECLIFIDFHTTVLKSKVWLSQKIESTVFLLVGLFAIAGIFGYLVLAWFAKLEFLSLIMGIYWMYFVFLVPFLIITIGYFWWIYSTTPASCLWKALSVVVIIFLVCATIIVIIPFIQGMTLMSDQISKYHSNNKNINVGLKGEIWRQDNRTPVIVFLNETRDAYAENNFTFIDGQYAECYLSTNYGNFVTVSAENSLINRPVQELIVPGCKDLGSATFWTYNIDDFGKQKPQVAIGLVVRDSIKKDKNSYGESRILLNWIGDDTISINNNVSVHDSPF